jgi:hypothetical protein
MVGYLMMLSLLRLCSFNDKMFHECGTFGAMRIAGGN